MKLVRKDVSPFTPFMDVERLLDQMHRLPNPANYTSPALNLYEHEQVFNLLLDMPGVAKEDISVDWQDNVLTISAERNIAASEEYRVLRSEMVAKPYLRKLEFSVDVVVENIVAKYENGVLSLEVPKKIEQKSQPHRILIQ
jgi:HSP20 family protein